MYFSKSLNLYIGLQGGEESEDLSHVRNTHYNLILPSFAH